MTFERKTNKECHQFLFITKGLCAELSSILYLPLELNKILIHYFDKMNLLSVEIFKLFSGLKNFL
ncbi:MAG: hypothetical protein ACE5DN_04340 [Flavobacteriales bacterium]